MLNKAICCLISSIIIINLCDTKRNTNPISTHIECLTLLYKRNDREKKNGNI